MRATLSHQETVLNYIEVLKPRETTLLTFIGVSSGIIAAQGWLPPSLFVHSLLTIALGSAACNGLTNYLDRRVDAKMLRTYHRALPSGRINPAEKVLPLIIGLLGVSLTLAWLLHPLCFIFGLTGIAASVLWRKTASCTLLGIVAGCMPVLIGWFAVNQVWNEQIFLLCLLIALWIPLHVWSVMIANREDYLNAGLSYFPLNLQMKTVTRILLVLSVFLYVTSLLLYFVNKAGLLFLVIANIFGVVMVYANFCLSFSVNSRTAWQVHKFSTFPYLGIVFLTLAVDGLLM